MLERTIDQLVRWISLWHCLEDIDDDIIELSKLFFMTGRTEINDHSKFDRYLKDITSGPGYFYPDYESILTALDEQEITVDDMETRESQLRKIIAEIPIYREVDRAERELDAIELVKDTLNIRELKELESELERLKAEKAEYCEISEIEELIQWKREEIYDI